ncbi:hypothetical protein GCM10008022_20600 [Paenibacillus hunanensis]|uniref:Uncharacterized protein n=1 Tax=Paenibacillus hunanensis TaxID=539262 RepID=A0ABU1IV66_9BACL|nr:hypothetical protein [Paenibacillus hunanensis]GGJ11337.1 hypothetical protein GCM10008022_20600 [Paenibacillus hunanensis]
MNLKSKVITAQKPEELEQKLNQFLINFPSVTSRTNINQHKMHDVKYLFVDGVYTAIVIYD